MSLLKTRVKNVVLRRELLYRAYLRYKGGRGRPSGLPATANENAVAVLQCRREWEEALEQVKALGLPPHPHAFKNWDSLIALDRVLRNTNPAARILDAGTEIYSAILSWLYMYDYRDLTGINLTFDRPVRRGPISYMYGDITRTEFDADSFDAITCLSVIEHGVDLEAFFHEMSRILKSNAILVVSTDYYADPIDTENLEAYGVPVHIFSKDEIVAAIETAKESGLEVTGPIDLECKEKAVRWQEMGLDFTFLSMKFRLA